MLLRQTRGNDVVLWIAAKIQRPISTISVGRARKWVTRMIRKGPTYTAIRVVQYEAAVSMVHPPQLEVKLRLNIMVMQDDKSCQGECGELLGLFVSEAFFPLLHQQLVYQLRWQMQDDLIVVQQSLRSLFRFARAGRWI